MYVMSIVQVSLQTIQCIIEELQIIESPTRPSMKNLKTIVHNYNVFQVHYLV